MTLLLQIVAGLCSLIKVEGVRDPLLEAHDKVAEPLLLFCQAPSMISIQQLYIIMISRARA